MINWCLLPRVAQLTREDNALALAARVRSHTDSRGWHRVIEEEVPGESERLTRCVGVFSVDDINGHHIH